MNAEIVGAACFAAKSIYDLRISRIPTNDQVQLGRENLLTAITKLEQGDEYARDEFAVGANGFFSTLGNIIRVEGKRGFRGWSISRIIVPDESRPMSRIYGMVHKSEVVLTRIQPQSERELATVIKMHKNGEINVYLGTPDEIIDNPAPIFSTAHRTKHDDIAITLIVSKMGSAFLDSLTMPRISKHEHFLTPQEKAKNKLLDTYQKWLDKEITDVPQLFDFATEIGNVLGKIVLSYGGDSKELKLPRVKSIQGGDSVSLALGESGSVFTSRSSVSRTGILNNGINEGDQIDFKRVSPDAPLDILSGRANEDGYSTRIAIVSTDLRDPNVEHAAAAIKRIVETTLALI